MSSESVSERSYNFLHLKLSINVQISVVSVYRRYKINLLFSSLGGYGVENFILTYVCFSLKTCIIKGYLLVISIDSKALSMVFLFSNSLPHNKVDIIMGFYIARVISRVCQYSHRLSIIDMIRLILAACHAVCTPSRRLSPF